MEIKIIVATHKTYPMPGDQMYLPLEVGAFCRGNLGYTRDDSGDNISRKNANYCELTGLYWAWKQLTSTDYIGLAHYRRHFKSLRRGQAEALAENAKFQRVLGKSELEALIQKTGAKVFLPKPRNYYIETNYSQYVHAHHAEDLDITREILVEKYPDYLPVYDDYMKRTIGHRFNMFIMERELFDAYCGWLFDILFTLEERLDISNYSTNDARVFGFVSERLLDVWLETNEISYQELPYLFMEKENWWKKGIGFLLRKLGGKKED